MDALPLTLQCGGAVVTAGIGISGHHSSWAPHFDAAADVGSLKLKEICEWLYWRRACPARHRDRVGGISWGRTARENACKAIGALGIVCLARPAQWPGDQQVGSAVAALRASPASRPELPGRSAPNAPRAVPSFARRATAAAR